MGTWNNKKAYGNDIAADWFGDFMDRCSVRRRWLVAMQPTNDPQTVRAAVWLFFQLGHVFVWPIHTHETDLELTIAALRGLPSEIAIDRDDMLANLVARRCPEERSGLGTPRAG